MDPKRGTYAGLFLVALATLTYEILLTRIFSVTMWYHFAFVAISVAMFGMTVGALLVYLLPGRFPDEALHDRLAVASLAFAFAIPLSLLIHLSVPFVARRDLVSLFSLGFTYVAIAIPFVCSGIVVALLLTRFPTRVAQLYAVDLAGAALGCLVLFAVLEVTDGPTAAFALAALAALAARAFATDGSSRRVRTLATVAALGLATLVAGNSVLVARQAGLLRLAWVKGHLDEKPLWEAWNAHSRIAVTGSPTRLEKPFGWGLSPATPPELRVRQLHLTIDAAAATKLTHYQGDPAELEFLRYDLINLAHYLRDDADVLVVGVGGGRDLLSALAFRQRRVTGVELNEAILRALRDRFGDFTGHVADDPRVRLVHDEARSYVTRSPDRYDVLQVSFIDTWAATAAGAYTLSENTLYTVEAWEQFLRSLKAGGVLSYSRWYEPEAPAAMYRLTALATAALARLGVENPRDHVLLATLAPDATEDRAQAGVGTILVSPTPFSSADLDRFEAAARALRADVMLSRRHVGDATAERLARPLPEMEAFAKGYPLDIEPPTDDNPFFFHLLRFGDLFHPQADSADRMGRNQQAVYILGALLAIVTVLTVVCVVLPLALEGGDRPSRRAWPYLVFFVAIGLGFMLIEISQMQRLNIFLGHPTYGLVVVLFTVLLASGLGSALSQRVTPARQPWLLVALLVVLVLSGIGTPVLLHALRAASTPVRVATAVLVLAPMGFLMGTPFPMGLARAAREHSRVLPWFWGINGATSVCASVLAVAIALFSSISTAFWVGAGAYLVAALAFRAAVRES